eukprot:359446-Chlamydomonas_euryale.AAC.11
MDVGHACGPMRMRCRMGAVSSRRAVHGHKLCTDAQAGPVHMAMRACKCAFTYPTPCDPIPA